MIDKANWIWKMKDNTCQNDFIFSEDAMHIFAVWCTRIIHFTLNLWFEGNFYKEGQ